MEIAVSLTPHEVRIVAEYAQRAQIGGRSSVRDEDRAAKLAEDQLVGQAGTLAFCKYLYGNALGHYLYRSSRWAADRAPTVGDGGTDLPGGNVDVKASLIRSPDLPRLKHHLPVRPEELHPGTVYVLALVEEGALRVYLMGWLTDAHFGPDDKQTAGTFKGAYTRLADELNPLPPLTWGL